MPYFKLALQRHQRAQSNCSKRMRAFPWDLGQMCGPIDLSAFHRAPNGDRMATEIAKVAAANLPQEIKIDDNSRRFAQFLFRLYWA
jgi:hypothetical protein